MKKNLLDFSALFIFFTLFSVNVSAGSPSINFTNYSSEIINTEFKRGVDSIHIETYYEFRETNGVLNTFDSIQIFFEEVSLPSMDLVEGKSVSATYRPITGFGLADSSIISTTFLVPADFVLTKDLLPNHTLQIRCSVSYNGGVWANVSRVGIKVIEGSTALSSTSFRKKNLYVSNGIVYLHSDVIKVVGVYSVSGALVKSVLLHAGENSISNLTKGFYIIDRKKVIVR